MKNSLAAWVCVAVAVLSGATVLVGWAFHIPVLIQIRPTWAAMVINTALCLILGGLALALPDHWRGRVAVQRICGAVLFALGSLVLSENLLDGNFGVDWPVLHRWLLQSNPHPGRMAPNTSLGFVLAGLALAFAQRTPGRWLPLRQGLALGVIAIGATGLLGYLLRFELLYSWSTSARMAAHTALGLTTLGTGLLIAARQELPPDPSREEDGRDILTIVSGAVTIIAVVIALGVVAFMLDRIERMTTDHLQRQYQDRSQNFISAILQGITRAGAITTQTDALAQMRNFRNTASARKNLAGVAQSFLSQGFTWIAFAQDGHLLADAGSALRQTEMEVALYQGESRQLIWRDGFYLRLRLPMRDARGPVGEVVTEQPLDTLTSLLASTEEWGETSEMLLCTLDSDPFRCFPARSQRTPFTSPHIIESNPLPMTYALDGAGTVSTRDVHGHRVIAAYGPIGNSGLGMVLKIDWAELYAPIRKQLPYLLITLVLAVAVIRWLVQRRLRPLVRQLVESRRAALMNEARFLSAAESNLDAFYILESVHAEGGEIADFRFSYVNDNGARMASAMTQRQFPGQLMSELFPLARQEGFFDKYRRVAESGVALAEEFLATAPNVKGSWLSQQVVRLGDGITITLRDISERKTAEEKLKYLAQNDMLTELPNRALFLDRLKQAIARVRRNDQILAMLFMDVDHFKNINDTYGHAAGDELLRVFAERLRCSVRETDTVARLGGDEFTAILEDVHGPDEATTVVTRFLTSLQTPIRLPTADVTITTSIGIALYARSDGELSPDALLERADEALYGAKHRGRNGYVIYAPNLEHKGWMDQHLTAPRDHG